MGFIKKDKKKNNYDRIFLDRKEILDLIAENVCSYNEHANFFKLFAFYGMGGMGKSQLLREIYNTYRGSKSNSYHFPLEILNSETIPSILLHIRKKFNSTPHFDYALFRYYDFISYDRVDRESLYSISQKLCKKLGKLFDSIVGHGVLDTESIVRKLIIAYEERVINDKDKEAVSTLLQDKIEDFYKYLAENLAKDIQEELRSQKYIFLFDAYDLDRSSYNFDWLKYFIDSFENGMFFVTSRKPLDWFNDPNVDKNVIKNQALECIPRKEVHEYLLNQDYTREQIDLIIKKTSCIPIYLKLALEMNTQDLFSLSTHIEFDSKEELVKNLLNHMGTEEQEIINYLSVVNIFNEKIYYRAVQYNKYSPQNFSFSDFMKSTIAGYGEQFNDLYKIHDVVAQNIALFINKETRGKIIDDYLTMICTIVFSDEDLYDDTKYNLIVNVYRLVEREKMTIGERQSENLIDLFFYLFDRGYGNDFYKCIIPVDNNKQSNLFYIYEYIIGKITRESNIEEGLKHLQSIPINVCNFGKHQKSLMCDINYILSISGKYLEAEERMNKFVNELSDDEKNESYYIKGILYNSDMQMLRGKFKNATSDLILLSDNKINKKLYYEIQKAIGHCYRFNFLFDKALEYYSTGDTNLYNTLYYLTVCCETYCYYKPQKVFDLCDKAIKENQEYNNHNNLGKIYYSMAIAKIALHDIDQVEDYIKNAYSEFNGTKYQAGILFTMMAEVYLEYFRTKDISAETISKLKNKLKEINNIYEYLLLPVYVIKKDQETIKKFSESYEWFDFNSTLKNIKKFLELIIPGFFDPSVRTLRAIAPENGGSSAP